MRMQADMRHELFSHLERLPFKYFDENKTGTIMSRIINDLQDVTELAHHGPEDIFLSVMTLIGACVLMAITVNPWLTLIVFSVIPFIVAYAVITRKGMRNAWKKMQRTRLDWRRSARKLGADSRQKRLLSRSGQASPRRTY